MMYKLSNLRLPVDFDKSQLNQFVAKKIKISTASISKIKLKKLSIDARKKDDVHFVATIVFDCDNKLDCKKIKNLEKYSEPNYIQKMWNGEHKKIIIVGSGPSGLFAGMELSRAGHKVTILERGYDMDKRKIAVNNLMENGILDIKSNIQFGEGGAGTFSDGKLNTGTKSIHIMNVLETFHMFGAKEDILYDAKPHIGTDILSKVIVNMRKYLESNGSKILFEHRVTEILTENNSIVGVLVDTPNGQIKMDCDILIMAIGHSSRDTVRSLFNSGVKFVQKPFSMGFRIEHLQRDINVAQYGDLGLKGMLPPADYHLAVHLDNGRVVYTFCMCPGGVVVPSMSEEGTIVTNGMSYSARDGINANSALLVTINPRDFSSDHPLSGIELQEKYERLAYEKNNSYMTTVQRVGDFLQGVSTSKLGKVIPTYTPGYVLGSVEDSLPKFVIDSVKTALPKLDKILNGFSSPDAILTAIETRSSAPFQVVRDDTMQSNISGLYMIGEGAGFAGGIVTSAVEGIKCANIIIDTFGF